MRRLACFLSSIMFMMALLMVHTQVNAAVGTPLGPRIPYIKFFPADYQCLKNGTIDILARPLLKTEYMEAITDPTDILGEVLQNDMFCFDINCNETILSYPGVFSPTSYVTFRRAIALLINKTYIVEQICGNFARRMDVPIQVNAPSWINVSVVYPNYPWEVNIQAAIGNLIAGGFIEGTTQNPYYDPGVPWSSQHIRVYPGYAIVHDAPKVGVDVTGPPYEWTLGLTATEVLNVMGLKVGEHWYTNLAFSFDSGTNKVTVTGVTLKDGSYLWIEYETPHPKAEEDLDELIIARHVYNPLLYNAGQYLGNILRLLGIPVKFIDDPMSVYFDVFVYQNYHIYTGRYVLPRYPTHMYEMYHSLFWGTSNIVAPPCPRPRNGPSVIDPNYDVCLEDIYYTENFATAIVAAKKAQAIHVWQVVNIPLWCTKSYYAWKNWLLGVCNMMGYGPINDYTFLKVYKAVGAPELNITRVGIPSPPQSLNILYAQLPQDYMILDRIWSHGQSFNPYDLTADQAWIVQDWAVSTWMDGSVEKTKVTYWIRKDVYWISPITGTIAYRFNTSDIEFSNMFLFAFPDSYHWNNVKDIHHICIVDDFCLEIYYNSKSYWFQFSGFYPLLPKYKWLPIFCTLTTYEEVNAHYEACEKLILYGDKVAQIAHITVNGVLLEPCQDYQVEFNNTGISSANIIHFKTIISGDLVINYWNITGDPHGFFPGSDTDWQTTTYSIGPYTPVDISGDHALFLGNSHYFMETPPLGEIDWLWWWGDRDSTRPAPGFPQGPRTGFFHIELTDVVYVCIAYGGQGYLEPDPPGPPAPPPYWVPGCDLSLSYTLEVPYGGEIDIYDLVAVTFHHDTKFGTTP